MKIPFVMTQESLQIGKNISVPNPFEVTDLEIGLNFYDFYRETCYRIAEFLETKQEVRILSGDGVLGLESVAASLTEIGDRVLVINNDVFSMGFEQLVDMYGGETVSFMGEGQNGIDIEYLKDVLEIDSNFKYAVVAHCYTQSGLLNSIDKICSLLKSKGILTVVDCMSTMGGAPLKVDEWNIDIAIGTSERCIAGSAGLSIISISKDAFNVMKQRRTNISSYYCNLLTWDRYYEKKLFPYTPPVRNIIELRKSVDKILEEKNIIERHHNIATAIRKSLINCGLDLYLVEGYSSTITAFKTPKGINVQELRNYMLKEHDVLIGGALGKLAEKVIRISHMGENAHIDKVAYTLTALQKALNHFKYELKGNLSREFLECINIHN